MKIKWSLVSEVIGMLMIFVSISCADTEPTFVWLLIFCLFLMGAGLLLIGYSIDKENYNDEWN